ncbi:hypothetical protein KUTeg_017775 [Tegillarca granosa]|uniref:protein-tyrosine-phosphatase n=1 Tax=Tegillarca granosa TaxID=220873 RepID=A0ABQ9EFW8_TEGGR|nr:hypothetical protein KUTeg_017775 [Tegillarca granosa]
MLTPGKPDTEQSFAVTPVVKKDLSTLLIDEDSGLGMENDDMVDVLGGKYDDVIGDFNIIDCRYPYEYNGGHIKTQHNKPTTNTNKASILIFHCEFSSERGPKLCRYLRAKDREMNSSNYPALNYPEVYLLNGGYKEFFLSGNKQWCEPMEYKPMLDSQHTEELRHFRAKSKSWTAGERRNKRSQRLNF